MGGVAFGMSMGGMHFVGMAALRVPGDLSWNAGFVAASLSVGGVFAALSLWAVLRLKKGAGFAASTALMVVAVCGLHFLGMAGVTITPNPRKIVTAGGIPHDVLAGGVGATTVAIGLLCWWTIWIEARGRRRSLTLIHSVVDAVPQPIAYFDADE